MAEKFTNIHFVEFLKKFVGSPYWYGCCLYPCTESLLKNKTAQYPKHYTSGRMSKYKSDIQKHLICADCVNLAKGYIWTNAGENVIESIGLETPLFKTKYASNGVPDLSANGMFEYAKSKGLAWGTIDTIPEVPGLAVRYDGHVGYYIGNGEVIEERGFKYGCVKTKLKDRKWLHWYQFPGIIYDSNVEEAPVVEIKLGDRSLKKGSTGNDVKELQHLLNTLLNSGLTEDGQFGANTETAVKAFQNKYNLTADGIYGANSHKALMLALSDTQPDLEEQQEENTNITLIATGALNIRAGDSTKYSIITTVSKDTKLTPICDKQGQPIISSNNWYAVACAEQIGWASGKYIKIK